MAAAWLSVAVLELIGAAVLTLTCARLAGVGWIGRLGLSFGAGLVFHSFSLFLLSLAGVTPAWWIGCAEAAVLWVLVVSFRRDALAAWRPSLGNGGGSTEAPWVRALQAFLWIDLAMVLAVATAASLAEPLVEWDTVAIWALKARVLLHDSVRASAYFHDPALAFSHLDYPLLWPFTMAGTWCWTGGTDPVTIKVLSPALLISTVAAFYGLVRRRRSRTGTLLLTAFLAGLPALIQQAGHLLSDPVVALLFLVAGASLYSWIESGDGEDLRLAVLFGSGLLFAKNEGIGLVGVLLLSLGAARPRRSLRQWLEALRLTTVIPFAGAVAWFAFRVSIPKLHEDYGARLFSLDPWRDVPSMRGFLEAAAAQALDVEAWRLLWPLGAFALLLTWRRWIHRDRLPLVLAVTLPLALYLYVALISPWNPAELVQVAGDRLLLHVAPLSLFLLGELTLPPEPRA